MTARGLAYQCRMTRKEIQADAERRGLVMSPAGEIPWTQDPSTAPPCKEPDPADATRQGYAIRLSLAACRETLGPVWGDLAFTDTGEPGLRPGGSHAARPDWLGDVVLARKDVPTGYHLAVCCDDAAQDITHVVRGDDLFHSTHIHTLLQALVGWPPPIYTHHRLIPGSDGRKLSKRDGAKSLRALRGEGYGQREIAVQWRRMLDDSAATDP